jgi:hypothetical protein
LVDARRGFTARTTSGVHGATAELGPKRGHRHAGPVAPTIMRDSIGLTGSALEQYTRRYNSHMAATKAARDSLRNAMEAVRSSARSGDHSAARERRGALRGRFEELARQDQQFEANLKDLISEDQQKRYTEWQDKQRDLARKRWRRGHRPDRGGNDS